MIKNCDNRGIFKNERGNSAFKRPPRLLRQKKWRQILTTAMSIFPYLVSFCLRWTVRPATSNNSKRFALYVYRFSTMTQKSDFFNTTFNSSNFLYHELCTFSDWNTECFVSHVYFMFQTRILCYINTTCTSIKVFIPSYGGPVIAVFANPAPQFVFWFFESLLWLNLKQSWHHSEGHAADKNKLIMQNTWREYKPLLCNFVWLFAVV